MKKITYLLLFMLFFFSGIAQTVTIGSGTTTTNGTSADPVERYYNYTHSQIVWTAAELTASGLPSGASLTGMGFSISESAVSLSNFTISMGHTSQVIASPMVATGLSDVKNSFTYAPIVQAEGSFDMITFDTPFVWDGTSNVVVNICSGSNPFTSPYGGLRTTTATSGAMRIIRTDGSSNCANFTGGTNYTSRPNVQFSYSSGACSGAPMPGNTIASTNPVCESATSTLSLQNATTGSGVTYQWYSSLDGVSYNPIGSANASNYVASQSIQTYYYCDVTCSGNTVSSTPTLITMNNFINCYCSAIPTSVDANGITDIQIGTLTNPNVATTTYQDFTSLVAPDLGQATTVPVTVTLATGYTYNVRVFIDFNQDGDFLDADENTLIGLSTNLNPTTISGNILVPATALLGNTRMRIVATDNDTSNDPCYSGSYANVEDYTVNILAQPTDTPDYVNLQWPPSATIDAGNSATVYGQVYEGGLTDVTSGQAPGIVAWVGISPVDSNTNPDTWTTWIPATFNVEVGNNDEYQAVIGSTLTPGTYYYATRFQLNGGPFRYGGIDASNNGNFWDGATYNSGVLTVNANPTQCATLVSPIDGDNTISAGTVVLSWTAPTSGPTPTGYKVYYGTTPNPTTLVATVTTLSYNANASAIGSTYYWRIVPTTVAGGDATSCAEFSFTTVSPSLPYCMPTYSNGGTTDDITNVTLGVLNNTTTGNTSPYYTYFNSLAVPDILAGSTINVSVSFGTHSTQWSAIWIDFNQDNVFDASEGFLSPSNPGANGTTVYSIPVPLNAVLGNTRMRVRGGDDSALTTSQACGASNSTWGETEDYIVNITSLCATTATWDGMMWTGTPSATAALVFNGDYTHTTATVLDGCSCTINGTSVVTFNDGTLNLQNYLATAAGTSLILESGASLVQVNTTVANDVLGTFTAKRNSANMVRLDYTGWSSPVVGQNALAFSPETLTNRFYEYDATANAYSSVVPSTTNFTAGKGLLVRAPNTWSSSTPTAYPGVFTGVPNNGNLTTAVQAGYNLLGNPYASPINAADFLSNANNATTLGMTTLYFWTHTLAADGSGNYATSNYATHNGAGGVAAAAGGATPDGIIQVGQGFIVDATAAGSAQFDNGMRLTTHNGQFFKTNGAVNQPTTLEKHRIWLDLTSPGNKHNQILVGYVQGATNAVDNAFDSKLFGQTGSVLYTPINNNKYVIQSRALPFSSADIVPLGFVAETAGQFTIVLNSFDGLFASQDIYLKDNLLNITHDIKTSAYTFASAAGEFASRFEIVYGAPLSVETPSFTEDSVVVYNNESGIIINAGNTLIDSVKVFDVRGRLLVTKSKVDANSIAIENVSTEKQVLIVQITSTDNVTISKKVIN